MLDSSIENRRSLAYIGNPVNAIILYVTHSSAKWQTYLFNNGDGISTPGLLHQLGAAMMCTAQLMPVSPSLLQAGAVLLGKRDIA